MAIRIGQCAPGYLPGDPLPDREAWRATVYRVAESQTRLKWPCAHRHKPLFCPWPLCPRESQAWRWSPSRICMAVARTVWFSFHWGCHRSAVSLSALTVPPLTQTIAPRQRSNPCFQGRSSPTNTPVSPPSFFLLSFAWFYIFFSSGQILLFTLSWCSACTSVSERVLLMYPLREMYSTTTYSSAILFPPSNPFIFKI